MMTGEPRLRKQEPFWQIWVQMQQRWVVCLKHVFIAQFSQSPHHCAHQAPHPERPGGSFSEAVSLSGAPR